MMRLPYDRKGRELLPKYAILNVRRPGFGSFPLPARYGGVAVVFKKEVSERATWTYADSLDYSQKTGLYEKGGAANPVLARTTRAPAKSADRNACGNYCEAQIWGKLTWRDVDYAMVASSAAVPAALFATGTPVYRYEAASNPGQTAQYVRGERLIAPRAATGARAAGSSPAVENFLRGEADARLPDAELVGRLEDSAAAAKDSGAVMERRRLLGELAGRRKSPAVVRELDKAAVSPDAADRALALYGLSELPWREFKPRLLAALGDEDPRVAAAAVAFSFDHAGDGEVAGRLKALARRTKSRLEDPRNAGETVAAEWLDRLQKPLFCADAP